MEKLGNICSDEHRECVSNYCFQCKKFICESCLLDFHFTHESEIKELNSYYSLAIGEYKSYLNKLERNLKIKEKHIKLISIDEYLHKMHQKIESTYNELHADIEKHKAETQNQILNAPFLQEIKKRQAEFETLNKESTETITYLQSLITDLESSISNRRFIQAFNLIQDDTRSQIEAKLNKILEDSNNIKLITQEIEEITIKYNPKGLDLDNIIISTCPVQRSHVIQNLNDPLLFFMPGGASALFTYDLSNQSRRRFLLQKDDLVPVNYFAALKLQDRFFICGGYNKASQLQSTFYIKNGVFQQKEDMFYKREDHSLVLSSPLRQIYVLAGNGPNGLLNQCEKFSLDNEKWTKIPPLNRENEEAAAVLHNSRFIHYFGTKLIKEFEVLDLFEEETGWKLMKLTAQPEEFCGNSGLAGIQISEKEILLFGGESNNSFIFHSEKLAVVKYKSLKQKSEFRYPIINPLIFDKNVYAVDKGGLIHTIPIENGEWKIIGKIKP